MQAAGAIPAVFLFHVSEAWRLARPMHIACINTFFLRLSASGRKRTCKAWWQLSARSGRRPTSELRHVAKRLRLGSGFDLTELLAATVEVDGCRLLRILMQ